MQLSGSGLNSIKQYEGFRPTPYNDGAGYMTIGYGHQIQPGERFTRLSEAEALQLLASDVAGAESAVNNLVQVPLTQPMFDALTSLVFNWGASHFRDSTHLQKLNAGDYQGAAQRISEHPITGRGKLMPGLVRRRREEAAMFLSGGIPGNPPRPPREIPEAADKMMVGFSMVGRPGLPATIYPESLLSQLWP